MLIIKNQQLHQPEQQTLSHTKSASSQLVGYGRCLLAAEPRWCHDFSGITEDSGISEKEWRHLGAIRGSHRPLSSPAIAAASSCTPAAIVMVKHVARNGLLE